MLRPFTFFLLVLLLATPLPAQVPPAATAPATTPAPAADPLGSFLARYAALADDDVPGRLELAQWCHNQELYPQLAQVAGDILAHQPENKLAWSYMREADDKVPLPDDPKATADLKTEFAGRCGHDFNVRATHHFLLVFDTPEAAAAAQCFSLEQAYDAFLSFFNLKTVHPRFLERRLVAILFKDRQDYLRYSKEADGVEMTWSAGYYSQRTNRAAFFDDATSATNEKLQTLIEKLKLDIPQMTRQIDAAYQRGDARGANALFAQRREATTRLAIAGNMLRSNVAGNNKTKTIHEATHALAFNTGIQKRLVDYPFWLSEGLACCFEFEDHLHGMGPASINRGRAGVLHDALKNKTPAPADTAALTLEHLITAGPARDISDHTLGIYYASSWALFHYLYRNERPGLEKLLRTYAARIPTHPIPPEEHLKLFKEALGEDLGPLSKRFHADLEMMR